MRSIIIGLSVEQSANRERNRTRAGPSNGRAENDTTRTGDRNACALHVDGEQRRRIVDRAENARKPSVGRDRANAAVDETLETEVRPTIALIYR